MSSLLLTLPSGSGPTQDPGWDLCVDVSGNIALASPPYSLAQDVACAVRLFLGELWYDYTQGVPYFQQILGYLPSVQFMKAQFIAAALSVPGIASCACFLFGPGKTRQLGGQLQLRDQTGTLLLVQASNLQGLGLWYISGVSWSAATP